MSELIKVSKRSFFEFIEKNNPKQIKGVFAHEKVFIDEQGITVAASISSSYGAPTVYRTVEGKDPHCNIETMQIVSSIMG
tara:strand:- start:654 stop:893 length:240 start_codon:yes stop_codon:yes gene_type:complete